MLSSVRSFRSSRERRCSPLSLSLSLCLFLSFSLLLSFFLCLFPSRFSAFRPLPLYRFPFPSFTVSFRFPFPPRRTRFGFGDSNSNDRKLEGARARDFHRRICVLPPCEENAVLTPTTVFLLVISLSTNDNPKHRLVFFFFYSLDYCLSLSLPLSFSACLSRLRLFSSYRSSPSIVPTCADRDSSRGTEFPCS